MINKKDLELKLLLRESHIQQLNLRVDNLSSTINTLLQRNDDLKERINKAIEYIEKHKHLNWYNDSCYMNDLLEILDILRGEDDEN